MLSHDNLVYNTKMASRYLEMIDGEDRICSYLPLSHAAAQVSFLSGVLGIGIVPSCWMEFIEYVDKFLLLLFFLDS